MLDVLLAKQVSYRDKKIIMQDDQITQQKKILRCQMRQKRQSLPDSFCRYASCQIARHANRFLRRDRHIAVYWAYGSELSLLSLIQKACKKKAVLYLPQISSFSRQLNFVPLSCRLDGKIFFKKRDAIKHVASLDMLFVPLLAIDRNGNRLGQGGGFYDTTLRFRQYRSVAKKPLVIGVAYQCQWLESVPHTAWDIPLDGLITEIGLKWFIKHPLSALKVD